MEARVQDATIVGNMDTTPGNARIPKAEGKEEEWIRKEEKEDSRERAIYAGCGDIRPNFAGTQGKEEEQDQCHFHGHAIIAE